jgi:putative hemolysin
MRKEFFIIGLILGALLLAGCAQQPGQLVGNDTDEHGCKASAGYSWCEAKQKCIRTWEENCTAEGCGTCPQLSPPAPGFCEGGTITAGKVNECGCQGPPQCIRACTEEAKICPDGITTVARNGSNNCEFDPCPSTGIPNPASKFCIAQGGESKIITAADGSQSGICVLPYDVECDEWAYFRGECPIPVNCTAEQKTAEACTLEYMPVCGDDRVTYGNKCAACASKKINLYTPGECPAKTYVSRDLEQCKVIRYICIKDKQAFTDEFGCGCEPVSTGGKLKANDCLPEQRNVTCTKEYVPVCGWRDVALECNYPPCKQTYGNKCVACAEETVAYWTEGECPDASDGSEGNTESTSTESTGIANPASVFCEEQGGTVDIRDDAEGEGQIGICILPDNSECEEWAYFRGECTQ